MCIGRKEESNLNIASVGIDCDVPTVEVDAKFFTLSVK